MRKLSGITKFAALVVAGTGLLALSAQASLTIDSPGVVGTVKDGSPASPAVEAIYMNHLLGLGINTTTPFTDPSPIGTHTYTTGAQNGVLAHNLVTSGTQIATSVGVTIPAGWEYVLVKYGNVGDVVWYAGGASITIPGTSAGLGGTWEHGNGISHYTLFNAVPEPTTMIAGALLLLPFGASTLRMLRKKQVA